MMRAWMLLWVCTLNTAYSEEFTSRVIVVLDGDTVLVLRDSRQVKIRLAEIDAPEVGHAGMGGQPPNSQEAQEYGMVSRQSLMEMVLRKQVRINSQAVDQYGRMVAQIEVGGLKVNEEQVRRGMAWEYSYRHSNQHYIALQSEAQLAHRGLWAQSNPIPPWVWRKQHPGILSAPSTTTASAVAAHTTAAPPGPTCGNKKYCSEMSSCEEARHYFVDCGIKSLDGNRNGMPCEKLCAPQK